MLNLMSFSSSDFGRYASQTEFSMDEINDINERMQTQNNRATNTIQPLMSLPVVPPLTIKPNQDKPITPVSVIKENIEPLPYPSHGLGPIQRPRPQKLEYSTTDNSSFFMDSTKSPNTPDVLVQINHLLDHQNSVTTISSTPTGPILNELSSPNVPWTPFSPPDWQSKYDSSWPATNILTKEIRNPFEQQHRQQQQQQLNQEPSIWPSALDTTASSSELSNQGMQNSSEWDGILSPTIPPSTETVKTSSHSWLKYLPAINSSSVDNITLNMQEKDTKNTFWNSMNTNETQQKSSVPWWPNISSNENNNDKDQSRWDFAR